MKTTNRNNMLAPTEKKKTWKWSEHIISNLYANKKNVCLTYICKFYSHQRYDDHFKNAIYEHSVNCVWYQIWNAQMWWESNNFTEKSRTRVNS